MRLCLNLSLLAAGLSIIGCVTHSANYEVYRHLNDLKPAVENYKVKILDNMNGPLERISGDRLREISGFSKACENCSGRATVVLNPCYDKTSFSDSPLFVVSILTLSMYRFRKEVNCPIDLKIKKKNEAEKEYHTNEVYYRDMGIFVGFESGVLGPWKASAVILDLLNKADKGEL